MNKIKGEGIISIIFGILFGIMLGVGNYYFSEGYKFALNDWRLYFDVAMLAIASGGVIRGFLKVIPSIGKFIKNIKISKKIENLVSGADIKTFFFIFIIIALLWILPFLAVYPGYFTYDGLVQLDQFHKNKLSAWQPLTHTMLLNVLVDFGINVFQNASVGITIYCILQALLIISTFSYLVVFLAKRKVPSVLLLGITIFVALNPIVQILSFSTIKETFFICFFILFLMFLIEMLEDPEKYFSKKLNILKPIIVAIIMSLFRKQGIYIFMILVPVSAIFLHKYWKQLLILFIGVLIPTFLFFGPITKSLNVKESPISEMLSIPIQQISAVVVNNKDSLTEEEWETIKRYFSEESFKNYIPQISDPIKDNFNNEEIKKDKISFIKLWMSLGLKNKNIYAKSFIDMNIGYFYPSVKTISNWAVIHPYIENNPYNIKLNSLCKPYYNYLQSATNYFFEGRPLITLYVCEAMPTWVILIILIVLIYKKQYKLIIPIFGLLLYLATCFLAPVCCIRYVYPLIMSLILVVSLPFMKKPI